mmetsp:Transcript_8555/g.13602  ORF Transcript_8555/g.13602 Transcript_8555/m.13602 type:complete len:209 (-) Transcript_8555:161-787(-)
MVLQTLKKLTTLEFGSPPCKIISFWTTEKSVPSDATVKRICLLRIRALSTVPRSRFQLCNGVSGLPIQDAVCAPPRGGFTNVGSWNAGRRACSGGVSFSVFWAGSAISSLFGSVVGTSCRKPSTLLSDTSGLACCCVRAIASFEYAATGIEGAVSSVSGVAESSTLPGRRLLVSAIAETLNESSMLSIESMRPKVSCKFTILPPTTSG